MFVWLNEDYYVNMDKVEEVIFHDKRMTITFIFESGRSEVMQFDDQAVYTDSIITLERKLKL